MKCFLCCCFQLRKAIEEVNSGSLTSNQISNNNTVEKPPLQPQEEPLLSNENEKNIQSTVDSMDSALTNSDNCSDVEMGHLVDQKNQPK